MNLPDSYRGGTGGPPTTSFAPRPISEPRDRLDLRTLVSIFRRRIVMFGAIVGICVLLALLFTIRQPKEYSASADVVMNLRQEAVTPDDQRQQAEAPRRDDDIETELQIITSQALASEVIRELRLDRDASFVGMASRGRGMLASLRNAVGLAPAPTPPTATELARRQRALTDTLLARLKAARIGTAYAIRISYVDINPVRSAAVANAFARLYSANQVNEDRLENGKAIRLLEDRIGALRAQARADFQAVQNFRIANNLLGQNATALGEQELIAYNQQVALARADAASDQARLDAARAQIGRGSTGDDVGDALSSPVIHTLRAQRATISTRIADLSGRYLDSHPELITARRELADVDSQIQAEVQRTMSSLSARASASRQRQGSVEGNMGSARASLARNNGALVGLDDLSRRAQASQALYESYLGRYKQVLAQSGTERADARILSEAKVPGRAQSPNVPLNLLLGLVVGTLLGAGASLAAESAYDGLTTGDDVEERTGMRYLGGVPLLASIEPRGDDPLDTVARWPGSAFAESIRSLLTSARQGSGGRRQVFMVTSALPGEGKTSIAACLARSAALGGERVIVIECDLVRRSLSKVMKTDEKAPGLRELLAGRASIAEVIVRDAESEALILPVTTPFGRGERLLEKGHFHALLAQLREEFDLIILDAAPILPIAETRELATLADSVILVAQWRKTPDSAVRSALRLMPLHAISDIGGVLNHVDMRKQSYFGYGDAAAFYRQYKQYYLDS
jgi:succinoglycan biosynthesis transport protein ExoP